MRLALLGLPDCSPPVAVYGYGGTILSDGSYLLRDDDSPLIFDVPASIRITIQKTGFAHESRYWLVLEHVDSQSRTRLNLPHNNEWGRETEPRAPTISAALDRIIESAWLGAPDTPYTRPPSPVRPALTAVSGGDAGEILLKWTIAEEGATRWQYRQSGPGEDAAWGAWTDIPRSDAKTMSHRLTGLQPEQLYQFEVRSWTVDGAGDASSTREAIALRAGLDRIPIALPGTALEGGRTFLVGETVYTFTVPVGLPLALGEVTQRSDGSIRIIWEEPRGSDWVAYDTAPRGLLGGKANGDTWALYRQLLESVREGPPSRAWRSPGPIALAVAIAMIGLMALAVARWRGRV